MQSAQSACQRANAQEGKCARVQDDNNTGTYPLQSERFYAALKGHGAPARLVLLPHESHGAPRRSLGPGRVDFCYWVAVHQLTCNLHQQASRAHNFDGLRGTNLPQPGRTREQPLTAGHGV